MLLGSNIQCVKDVCCFAVPKFRRCLLFLGSKASKIFNVSWFPKTFFRRCVMFRGSNNAICSLIRYASWLKSSSFPKIVDVSRPQNFKDVWCFLAQNVILLLRFWMLLGSKVLFCQRCLMFIGSNVAKKCNVSWCQGSMFRKCVMLLGSNASKIV